MDNIITITIEVNDATDIEEITFKASQGALRAAKRIPEYLGHAYTSVLGPDGITFEPPQGGDADHGDDARVRVNIREE